MSKPVWIRCVGWLSLFLLIVPLAWPLSEKLSGHSLERSNLPGYMWAAFVPVFLFWLIASLISGIIRYSSKMKAKALEQMHRSAVADANRRPWSAHPATKEEGASWETKAQVVPPPANKP